MSVCTFFGHRDCYEDIDLKLGKILIDLIENHNTNLFYIGNQGHFDSKVKNSLKNLQKIYPHIKYYIVLAYLPEKNNTFRDYSNTIIPEGIENIFPRYAISWRNRWMVDRSDYVVTYITHPTGGAAKFAEIAKKKGKTVINIKTACI